MKALYIHIGHYKTGTSALQLYCSTHIGELARGGCLYPSSGRPGARTHHADLSLPLAIRHGFTPPHWYSTPADPDRTFAAFRAEVQAADVPRVLISSEEFAQLGLCANPHAAVTDLRDRLVGFDVRVLFYLRDPMALLISWYNQSNKGPEGTRTFPVFFETLAEGFLSQLPIYRAFADVFGAGHVLLRSYRHTGMDHIRDVLSAIGHGNLPTETGLLSVNESLDLQILELVRLAKTGNLSREQATLSRFSSLHTLSERVARINAAFDELSALAPEPTESSLSLVNIFRHHRDLVAPLRPLHCADRQEATLMRKAALEAEDRDPELALALMQVAQAIRPRAPFIARKIAEYELRTCCDQVEMSPDLQSRSVTKSAEGSKA